MNQIIRTLFLLGLPASGTSDLSSFLSRLSPDKLRGMRLGGTLVHLTDAPYLAFMRAFDRVLCDLGYGQGFFFNGPNLPLACRDDWLTLSRLLSRDYADAMIASENRLRIPDNPGMALLERIIVAQARDRNRRISLHHLPVDVRDHIGNLLNDHVRSMMERKRVELDLDDTTFILEFARGGEIHHSPLLEPCGYLPSLRCFDNELLTTGRILFVHVTPAQARARNFRAPRNTFVPLSVMLESFGCCDLPNIAQMSVNNTGAVRVHDYRIPMVVFDNQQDRILLPSAPLDSEYAAALEADIRSLLWMLWAMGS